MYCRIIRCIRDEIRDGSGDLTWFDDRITTADGGLQRNTATLYAYALISNKYEKYIFGIL